MILALRKNSLVKRSYANIYIFVVTDKAPTGPDKSVHRDEPARKILNLRPGYKVYDQGPDSVPQDERTFEHGTRGKVNIEDPHPALPGKRSFNYGTGIGHHTHDDEEQYLNDLEELLDSFGHILID